MISSDQYRRRLRRRRRRRRGLGLLFGPFRDPKTVEPRRGVHGHFGDTSLGKPSGSLSTMSKSDVGYMNLSCPYEMSKYSCSYIMDHREVGADGGDASMTAENLDASTNYYLENMEMIRSTFHFASMQRRDRKPRRIFLTGDSLMRQLFIAIACNAMSSLPGNEDLIEESAFPWKDVWPTNNIGPFLVTGGKHSGFDAASIRLTNGVEIHFVPHRGYLDDKTAEKDVLERLHRDIIDHNGRITFGNKTAMPLSPDTHVDVLVYNDGIHYQLGRSKKNINHFINWVSKPLMMEDDESQRTRTVYVTTPTQHYNTNDGQWKTGEMGKEQKVCINRVDANPRAELEKELLKPGENVDVLFDYDDLNLGMMHVRSGNDCSHYCMPGVPDVVAARLMREILT
ncbi:hypothetical protein ACHAXA_008967 [Cyclostephanos tholiformis]|uniref:Uncharacterized protein n=1 Tax=Cyclostephanos tholiformis TaxID=382380 RepID=A0ABD3SBM5_9STRA